MDKIIEKLNSIQGYFVLSSLEARIAYSSKIIGFDAVSSSYVKSSLEKKDFDNLWARGVFFHEITHYYQNTMTPIGVFLRLLVNIKTFLTFNFMSNANLDKTGMALKDLNIEDHLYENFLEYYNAITELQSLIFGTKNYTQKEAFDILSRGLGVCNILGINAPNYFSFLKIDTPLNYVIEENQMAIPFVDENNSLFSLNILFEGWAACVQVAEFIDELYYEANELNLNLNNIIEKIFYDEYKVVPQSVSVALYDKKLQNLEIEEFFIVVNITKILCELSFYSPIHPSFVDMNNVDSIEWNDIYPTWRFLKALSIIDEIDLSDISSYHKTYEVIVENICNKFYWKRPKDFSSNWDKIKRDIDLVEQEEHITHLSISQKKILQAYDASISIKKDLGVDIFSLYPHQAEQLTSPRKGNESLLIPPIVIFSDREMIDIDNFKPLFFQYMFYEYVTARYHGYKFESRKLIEEFFVTNQDMNDSRELIEQLICSIDIIIDEILK